MFEALRLAILASLLWPASAGSRPLSQGLTISVRPPTNSGTVVCTGFCPRPVDITVWADGQVVVNGVRRARVTKAEAAQFRAILAPFRLTASEVDPSTVFPNACQLKVQWPVKGHHARPTACGDFMVPNPAQMDAHHAATNLFEGVQRALSAVHLNILGL